MLDGRRSEGIGFSLISLIHPSFFLKHKGYLCLVSFVQSQEQHIPQLQGSM